MRNFRKSMAVYPLLVVFALFGSGASCEGEGKTGQDGDGDVVTVNDPVAASLNPFCGASRKMREGTELTLEDLVNLKNMKDSGQLTDDLRNQTCGLLAKDLAEIAPKWVAPGSVLEQELGLYEGSGRGELRSPDQFFYDDFVGKGVVDGKAVDRSGGYIEQQLGLVAEKLTYEVQTECEEWKTEPTTSVGPRKADGTRDVITVAGECRKWKTEVERRVGYEPVVAFQETIRKFGLALKKVCPSLNGVDGKSEFTEAHATGSEEFKTAVERAIQMIEGEIIPNGVNTFAEAKCGKDGIGGFIATLFGGGPSSPGNKAGRAGGRLRPKELPGATPRTGGESAPKRGSGAQRAT